MLYTLLHGRVKAGSQYDTSLDLRPLHCDKILKTDLSNAIQLTKNRIRSYFSVTLHLTVLKEAHHLHNTTH